MPTRETMVDPQAIEVRYFEKHPRHNAIWDITSDPAGRVYIGLCNEGDPQLSAQMYLYDVKQKSLTHLFDADEVSRQDLTRGQIPQSKFHTGIAVGTDGKIWKQCGCRVEPVVDTTGKLKALDFRPDPLCDTPGCWGTRPNGENGVPVKAPGRVSRLPAYRASGKGRKTGRTKKAGTKKRKARK